MSLNKKQIVKGLRKITEEWEWRAEIHAPAVWPLVSQLRQLLEDIDAS